VRGKVLLGWLSEANAVRYLREDCIFAPQLTEEQAKALWEARRAAVDALGRRQIVNPPHLQMTPKECGVADRFLAHCRKIPGNQVRDVVKLDPKGLVVYQLDVNLDRSKEYAREDDETFVQKCLATNRPNAPLQVAYGQNWGNFNLPHGEFIFVFNGQAWGVVQGAPHVGISVFADRTLLWTGYHRSHARSSIVNPEAKDRAVLAALTTEGNNAFGPGSTNPTRDLVLGECPPFLGDFFDERLCMEVELHKKRYELQVRATIARINDD
jgi:hypothetical protein